MSEANIPESRWRILEAHVASTAGEYAVNDVGIEVRDEPVLFGVDGDRCRHLLIPVEKNAELREDRRSAGVQVVVHELLERQDRRRFVDLACRHPNLNGVFAILAGEVLDKLRKDETQPDDLCIEILEHWRELLKSQGAGVLGTAALVGIFGELWQLKKAASHKAQCVDGWVGPNGRRHDLERGGIALEVKASTLRHGRLFEVHGHRQLEAPDGGQLYLAAMKLEEVVDRGDSVPDLLQQLFDLGVPRQPVITRLTHLGYEMGHDESYRQQRFAVVEDRLYQVDDAFPRIIGGSFGSGDVPAGVVDLKYMIDLTGEPPLPLSDEDAAKVFRRLAGAEAP